MRICDIYHIIQSHYTHTFIRQRMADKWNFFVDAESCNMQSWKLVGSIHPRVRLGWVGSHNFSSLVGRVHYQKYLINVYQELASDEHILHAV